MTTAEIIQTAIASLSNGRAREAMAALDRGLKATPADPVLLQMKAGAAWQAGDLYAADDSLRALVKANGGDTTATDLMIAQLALDLLEFDRSRAAIDRLLASKEQVAGVIPVAVRLLVWQGEREQALDILEKGLAAEPGDPHLLALAVTHDRDMTAACGWHRPKRWRRAFRQRAMPRPACSTRWRAIMIAKAIIKLHGI